MDHGDYVHLIASEVEKKIGSPEFESALLASLRPDAPPQPLTASISASDETPEPGGQVALSWSTTGATEIFISADPDVGLLGPLESEGELAVTVDEDTVFELTATNEAGDEAIDAVLVDVMEEPEPEIHQLSGFQPGGFLVPAGATWEIPPGEVVETDGGVLIAGRLIMRGSGDMANPTTLRIVKADGSPIDEEAFVGGGSIPLASDPGVWIIGKGVLDAIGTKRTRWTRGPGGFRLVDGIVVADEIPADWEKGDELRRVPHERFDYGYGVGVDTRQEPEGFEGLPRYKLGDAIPTTTLGDGTVQPTEVINFAADVLICGTPGGRVHITVLGTAPQTIKWIEIRWTGPRQATGDSNISKAVKGRKAFHIHMLGDASRGTLLVGVFVRDCGSDAFFPHASHGCTFYDCLAYDINGNGFDWNRRVPDGFLKHFDDDTSLSVKERKAAKRAATDAFVITRDVVYQHCAVVLQRPIPSFRGVGLTAFNLNRNTGGQLLDSFSACNQGSTSSCGVHWPGGSAAAPNVWTVTRVVTHANRVGGARVWWTTATGLHRPDIVIYHCGTGVLHGSYGNPNWDWLLQVTACGTALSLHAVSSGTPSKHTLLFDDANYVLRFGGYAARCERNLVTKKHPVVPRRPTLFHEVKFTPDAPFVIDEPADAGGWMDFVNCPEVKEDLFQLDSLGLPREAKKPALIVPGTTVRILTDGTARQLSSDSAWTDVPNFYPLAEPDSNGYQAPGEITEVS